MGSGDSGVSQIMQGAGAALEARVGHWIGGAARAPAGRTGSVSDRGGGGARPASRRGRADGAAMRAALGGEDFFMSRFTAQADDAWVALSSASCACWAWSETLEEPESSELQAVTPTVPAAMRPAMRSPAILFFTCVPFGMGGTEWISTRF